MKIGIMLIFTGLFVAVMLMPVEAGKAKTICTHQNSKWRYNGGCYRYIQGYDITEDELGEYELDQDDIKSPCDCIDACIENGDCKSWLYYYSDDSNNRKCYLFGGSLDPGEVADELTLWDSEKIDYGAMSGVIFNVTSELTAC